MGFSLREKKAGRNMLWPRLWNLPCVHHLSALCPPLVRLVLLAVAAPPVLVRDLSALCCWLWPRLQSLSATGVRLVLLVLVAPPILVRHLSALCPVRHAAVLVRQVSPSCVVGFCPPCVLLVVCIGGRCHQIDALPRWLRDTA